MILTGEGNMALNKVNINEALAKIEQPFTLIQVAHVGALVMHAYVCLGAVEFHRHIDHDELFLVRQGWMVLESEWGNMTLKPDEMVIVPKGVGHRSGAQLRAIVLLIQPAALADRKNGHRRLFAVPRENGLVKFKLMDTAAHADSFCPQPIADIEELTAQTMVGNGPSPEFVNSLSGSLWLVLQGEAQMEAKGEIVDMEEGDLIVIGQNVPHHWTGSTSTVMFLLSRWAEVKC
jgi:mannose-6-phosphate isomerase-like protein (cupin superfamily)